MAHYYAVTMEIMAFIAINRVIPTGIVASGAKVFWLARMELCCFCWEDLSSSVSRKKRKLLHRDACAEARSRLAAFLQEHTGKGIEDYEETKGTYCV